MNSRIRRPLYNSLKSWLRCCSLPTVAPQQKLKIILSKKEWIKGVMRRLWFYELPDALLFLRLLSVGEIATRLFLDWKGRALSKRGVVYGTLVFITELVVIGKQRKSFYVVSYSDEPSLEMVIILSYLHAIQCWSENFLLWMGGGGGGGGGNENC